MNRGAEARRFAKALYETAEERGVLEAVRQDLAGLRALIGASPDLARFLTQEEFGNPEQRLTALRGMFQGKVQPLTLDFLRLLEEAKSLPLLDRCAEAFEKQYRSAHGIVQVEVCVARPLEPAQRDSLRKRLAERFGASLEIAEKEVPSLLGGFSYQVNDEVYDYSVAGRLQRLRQRLSEVGP